MKREVETAGNAAPLKVWERNIGEEAVAILKTILLLGRPYGSTYIARLLRGDTTNYLKDPLHTQMETFGSFPRLSRVELRLRLQVMVENELVFSPEGDFKTFSITESGKDFLDGPTDLLVPRARITLNTQDTYLLGKLIELRRTLGKKESLPSYAIFTNYTLDCLVLDRPKTLKELLLIPGMEESKAEQFGAAIISVMKETEGGWSQIEMQNLIRKTQHATHQEVLRLFGEKHDTDEIAGILGIKSGTVQNYLMNFHRIGQLDLRPWIESQFDSKEFHKITTYFKKMGQVRLREAAKTLNIEVPRLALVRFYMASGAQQSIPMQTT